MKTRPFGFDLSVTTSVFDNHTRRPLSDMQGYFADSAAFRGLCEASNPVVYEVYEIRRPGVAGELLHGLSVVHAGVVGDEYFMTKGHYHMARDAAELYYCLVGHGMLLMENEKGECAMEELRPGRVVYVTPHWAHRSVNIGDHEDLVTFFVYPGHAGHDYGTSAQKGFRKRVLCRSHGPEIVDNRAWSEFSRTE